MGYSALKQHSEKKKHKGFSSTLQKVKDKEKVEEADKPMLYYQYQWCVQVCKSQGESLHQESCTHMST